MIIQIVSDLHLEYLEEYDLDSLIEKKNANILVLVGDIGSLYRYPQLIGFLDKVCRIYEYVLYVPGNHEYYKMNTNDVGICMKDLKQKMNDLETIFKNLIILDRKSVQFGNYCFVGCTLWSDCERFLKNRVKIHDITHQIYNRYHERDLAYIKTMIELCKKKNLKMVVMTHYAPTKKLLSKKNLKDRYNTLYATSLDDIINIENMVLWIYGHTHYNLDITENGTRLVSNQLGRKKDISTTFSTNFEINLE